MQGAELVEPVRGGSLHSVIALDSRYPDGCILPAHYHRHDQLFYGLEGVVEVTTPIGAWVMPPHRGLWIPAGTVHEVRMLGDVVKRNLYFEPGTVIDRLDRCEVLVVPPLMSNLLAEAVVEPVTYNTHGRAAALTALILHETSRLQPVPLSIPLPKDVALAARCRDFLRRPNVHDSIDQWSGALGISRRTFTRTFRQQTGLSFLEWRQQACLLAALPRLAAEQPVTTIALNLGYDNPAAFTTMFKRVLGSSPSAYIKQASTC